VEGIAVLCLLGGPCVATHGHQVPLPEGSKRLVAYVALHERRCERQRVAKALWPSVAPHRAAGNLRSAMWRLQGCRTPVLQADGHRVWLHPDLRVDVEEVRQWAGRVSAGRVRSADLDGHPQAERALDLLPGWYDDWVSVERERLRADLLDAMDALAMLLVRADRCADAVEAALTAVSVEPLRESAQRVLIEAHLAEGNRCEAWRSFSSYRELLVRELGVRPSLELRRLVLAD
jgi:DNA-binding SARP family transcriptional activator